MKLSSEEEARQIDVREIADPSSSSRLSFSIQLEMLQREKSSCLDFVGSIQDRGY